MQSLEIIDPGILQVIEDKANGAALLQDLSGVVNNLIPFSPKMDCKECKTRQRADNLIENYSKGAVDVDAMTQEEMQAYIDEHKIKCPKGHQMPIK